MSTLLGGAGLRAFLSGRAGREVSSPPRPPPPSLVLGLIDSPTIRRPLNMNPENRFICKRSALLLSPGFPPEPRMDLASFPGGAGGAEQD